MGFYIRKSISAGPFRFNLSSSGLGMSVGVRGFRLGTGPRGNYVHMGRGGLYYRASLNNTSTRRSINHPTAPTPNVGISLQAIETGDVQQMASSTSSNLLDQINDRASSLRSWPWVLGLTVFGSLWMGGQPELSHASGPAFLMGLAAAALAFYWDLQRRTVVVMYDLDDGIQRAYERFARALEKVGTAHRVWNIEAAGRIDDWKRNAGAGRAISRNAAKIGYGTPSVVKTNISIPAILGGKQSVYFFPDSVIVNDGKKYGIIPHKDIDLLWSDSIFLEEGSVPRDAETVGYSWQYVNKNGGPDRRFNNNRQIPRLRYQQMGLASSGGFRKILQISKYQDRSEVDGAYAQLVSEIDRLAKRPLETRAQIVELSDNGPLSIQDKRWLTPLIAVGALILLVGAWYLGRESSSRLRPPTDHSVVTALPAASLISPSFDCSKVSSQVLKLVCATPALASADRELATAYTLATNATPDPQTLRREQRVWIRKRNNSSANAALLQKLYTDRIAELLAVAKSRPSASTADTQVLPSEAPQASSEADYVPQEYHFVVGASSGDDASLALRSEPSEDRGVRIRLLRPGILLKVLEAQGDWSHIKTMAGEDGWVATVGIRCCRKV